MSNKFVTVFWKRWTKDINTVEKKHNVHKKAEWQEAKPEPILAQSNHHHHSSSNSKNYTLLFCTEWWRKKPSSR